MKEFIAEVLDYFKNYRIEDVINLDSKILFILESPHTQEVKNDYPVAGDSGVEMTKFIYGYDNNDAFGKILANPVEYKNKYKQLHKFSIMNISSAPMQKAALSSYHLSNKEEEVLNILEKLRVNYKTKKHKNSYWNQVKNIIINDFELRLKEYVQQVKGITYIIPCGRLAESYLNLIDEEIYSVNNIRIISDIPHPSFNQWRYADSMEKLDQILRNDVNIEF